MNETLEGSHYLICLCRKIGRIFQHNPPPLLLYDFTNLEQSGSLSMDDLEFVRATLTIPAIYSFTHKHPKFILRLVGKQSNGGLKKKNGME